MVPLTVRFGDEDRSCATTSTSTRTRSTPGSRSPASRPGRPRPPPRLRRHLPAAARGAVPARRLRAHLRLALGHRAVGAARRRAASGTGDGDRRADGVGRDRALRARRRGAARARHHGRGDRRLRRALRQDAHCIFSGRDPRLPAARRAHRPGPGAHRRAARRASDPRAGRGRGRPIARVRGAAQVLAAMLDHLRQTLDATAAAARRDRPRAGAGAGRRRWRAAPAARPQAQTRARGAARAGDRDVRRARDARAGLGRRPATVA